jgi:hypothetical protein
VYIEITTTCTKSAGFLPLNSSGFGYVVVAGVWFLHCHIELHITWGMEMVFIVKDGKGLQQTLPPPPADYPKC